MTMMTHPASIPCNSGPSMRPYRRFNVCMVQKPYRPAASKL